MEGALPKFSGDNQLIITKWIQEFDNITNVMKCSKTEQFIYARRMLKGSAALLLRSTKSNSWEGLKKELVNEFGRVVGAIEHGKNMKENGKSDAGEIVSNEIETLGKEITWENKACIIEEIKEIQEESWDINRKLNEREKCF